MRTVETFNKPGLEPVDELIANLNDNNRLVHAKGLRISVLWRLLFILISIVGYGFLSLFCLDLFIRTSVFWSWCVIIVLCPICLIYIPWVLISSFKKRLASFRYLKNIYENGIGAVGEINTLTHISGREQDCSNIERKRMGIRGNVRVDYTFEYENSLKIGTAILRESNAEYLYINRKVCVIYLPDNPAQSMLFPMPGNEFFEYRFKAE